MLYGPPGTGKTCIVNRITEEVLKNNGIVLFNPNPELVETAFKQLEGLQPDTLVMVIFEELDQLVYHYESELLSLLDGEIQKENIVYLATTNYIEKVPDRLKRPGRFSSVIDVNFPGEAARRAFLSKKLKSGEDVEGWVNQTEGLSIDEITECIKSVFCLGYKLDDVIKRIQSTNKAVGEIDDREHIRMSTYNTENLEENSLQRVENIIEDVSKGQYTKF